MTGRSPESYHRGLELSREAKRRRRGTCVDCGAPTRYGGQKGKPVSDLCHTCANHRRAVWTPELVIAAIQRFASEHGRPPVAAEWAHKESKPEYAPWLNTVRYLHGNWAAAIAAAGFPEPRPGVYQINPRPNDRPHVTVT